MSFQNKKRTHYNALVDRKGFFLFLSVCIPKLQKITSGQSNLGSKIDASLIVYLILSQAFNIIILQAYPSVRFLYLCVWTQSLRGSLLFSRRLTYIHFAPSCYVLCKEPFQALVIFDACQLWLFDRPSIHHFRYL